MLKTNDIAAIKRYLSHFDGVSVDFPYTKTLAVYSTTNKVPFAYLEKGRQLPEISLRIDSQLAQLLRDKYEEVAQARKLDPRQWSTIVLSGQLGRDEINALIDHSFQLASRLV